MTYDLSEIKQIRKKLNLTQQELARKADVSQSLIAKIESGRLDPTYSNAKKIFKAFDDLMQREEHTAKDLMIKRIITLDPNESIKSTIKKMRKYNISQMPVIDNDNCIGLVSEKSIIDKIAELENPEDVATLEIKDIMCECPPVINPNTSYKIVSSLLIHYPIILVAEKGKVIGLVTKADMIDKVLK